ncbi:MAG: NADP-dependent malic enzyme [Clostridia bacterium]|nr:NADP-dependent malic enzyme [Clostridia bacterium]
MDVYEKSCLLHEKYKGKLEVVSKVSITSKEELSLVYTPGVAEPCRRIHKNPEDVYRYTSKCNTIAVVTDGTAVLGLGDIGPMAALPVMEGKCALFKLFADVDAIPICLDTKDTAEIVRTVKLLAPSLGGINLEDIAAPRCFEIESELKKQLDIPVFHDDQHGTAIVVLAALTNALKIVNKEISRVKIVINGAGAAGTAIGTLLMDAGARNVIMCDKFGAICREDESLSHSHRELSMKTNPNLERGSLEDVLKGADVFIGVSAPDCVTGEMVKSMAPDGIVFAMANPVPEIFPDKAKEAGARVVGTGRSDYPNQINNVLAFPGIFRGALNVRAREITTEMKLAAAYAIANTVPLEKLSEECIVPFAFDKNVAANVARAVEETYNKNTLKGTE